ncbi:MAG: hypothetical protein MJ239_00110 [Bacilli bacterium]|nr:hypothetical protein [Bacilli bacterium]
MEKKKPNLVYVVFSLLGAIIISLVGCAKGMGFINKGTGAQSDLGEGFMYIIVAALLLIGTIFNIIGEFVERKDVGLIGILVNAIGFTVLLILETGVAVLPAFSAITFFAYSIFRVLGLYTEKKQMKVVTLIFSSITLFFLVLAGTTGLFAMNFHFYYVGYLFGYMFVGLAIFVAALFDLIKKKEEKTAE